MLWMIIKEKKIEEPFSPMFIHKLVFNKHHDISLNIFFVSNFSGVGLYRLQQRLRFRTLRQRARTKDGPHLHARIKRARN